MTKTQVKRGRGRPKKVVETVNQTEQITMEDIKKAMEEIVNERFEEEGITVKPTIIEETKTVEIDDNLTTNSDEYSDVIPLKWNSIFNVLTRMYEVNEEQYENVKYNKTQDCILVDLDEKIYNSYDKEIKKIKVMSGYNSLNYCGKQENGRLLITISM